MLHAENNSTVPRRTPILRVAVATLAAAAFGAPSVAQAADGRDEILVRHRASATASERADVRADAGVTLEARLGLPGVELVKTEDSRPEAIAALRDDPGVLWAEPNREVRALTNDTYWDYQYGLENLGNFAGYVDDADSDFTEAWAVSRGSGITVGVVDSGVRSNHPDLAGQLVAGASYTDDGIASTEDGNGHGTHVTGTIVALADNNEGVAGAAPLAKVKTFRALKADGSGNTSGVVAAFNAAGNQGLRVVNASLGSSTPSNAERLSISSHPNTLFVVAAGNDGVNVDGGASSSYPCAYNEPNVLCVGASTAADVRALWDGGKGSNYGATSVDLFAAGDEIASTVLAPDDYNLASGTSMASPLVAAAAALVASANPSWTAAQIKAALLGSVDHIAALNGVSLTGGRLNVARALGLDVGPDGEAPAAPASLTAVGAAGRVDLTWPASSASDLKDYRVWRRIGGSWSVVASSTVASAALTGLTPGESLTLRVTARDKSGEESAPTGAVTLLADAGQVGSTVPGTTTGGGGGTGGTSTGGGTAAGTPATGTGTGTTTQPAPTVVAPPGASAPIVALPQLTNLRAPKVRGRVLGIRFHLSSAATVRIVAKRAKTKSRPALTRRKTVALLAGDQYVAVARSARGLGLASGQWRVTVTLGTSSRTVAFKLP